MRDEERRLPSKYRLHMELEKLKTWFKNIFLKTYIEIIIFLIFTFDFLYHNIKTILKYQKILIGSKNFFLIF
jgi:hypothetical protein